MDVGGGAGRGGTVLLALLGSLTRWLALRTRGPRAKVGGGSAALAGASVDVCGGDGVGRGEGSGACFAWLASGLGR